jgi:hypothetical protein
VTGPLGYSRIGVSSVALELGKVVVEHVLLVVGASLDLRKWIHLSVSVASIEPVLWSVIDTVVLGIVALLISDLLVESFDHELRLDL